MFNLETRLYSIAPSLRTCRCQMNGSLHAIEKYPPAPCLVWHVGQIGQIGQKRTCFLKVRLATPTSILYKCRMSKSQQCNVWNMFSKGSRGNFDPKIKVGVTANKFLFLLGNGWKNPVTESVHNWVKGVMGTPFLLTKCSLLGGFFGEKRIPPNEHDWGIWTLPLASQIVIM